MKAAIAALLAAQAELAGRPVDRILAALNQVTARWLDHADPIRVEAERRLAESTGLAPAMLKLGLDQMISRVGGIGDLLDRDLGDRRRLDGFGPSLAAPGLQSRAYGPGLLVCVFAGNVPAIPAFDMALALALKSACLARPPAQEPHFAGLFAQSVAQVDPLLGRALAVERWAPDDPTPYAAAGAVLAYGSDASVAAIGRMVPPGVRFLGHGHKIGLAVVAREAADEQTAAQLALDVAMYEQQGCVSPQMAFVERGGRLAPAEFARECGQALARLEQVMPRAALTLAEAGGLRAARDEAEFAADACFASPGNLAWTVVHKEQAEYGPSPLNRLLRTYAVDEIGQVAAVVAPHGSYLQTVAFAGAPARRLVLADALGKIGVSRICPVGRAQQPHPLWHHDGRPTAGDLVRWTDVEEG